MKVAMLAPPWLPIPPVGYGGIENVLLGLVPALMELGVDIELFTVGESTLKANKNHFYYQEGQYKYIHEPMYNSLPIALGHTLFAFNIIKEAGDFDIIHAHSVYTDPIAVAYCTQALPPMVCTHHGPPFTTPDRLTQNIPDNMFFWRELGKTNAKNVHIIGISKSLMSNAPKELAKMTLPPVHNSVDPALFQYSDKKEDYFMTLARSHPDKGQAIAVQACAKLGYRLKLAGVVANMTTLRQVLMQLANPLSPYRSLIDFKYFSDEIFPYLESGKIDYVGDVSGQAKQDLLKHAKALLFPIQWDEPFGMAPIEALACGTPVVAMARGALPEIIEHGVNGFLANNVKEFEEYMKHVGEIDPANCRKSVEERFSARHMAEQYLERYKTAIKLAKRS